VSTLLCIDVGGHITQNTTWSPDNNPYIITSFLYVDAGITLTILPGTQVRCTGADKNNIYNFMWSGNNQPVSKMIIVNGAINAYGTSDNPIIFDKYQKDTDYRWGGIYMYPNAPISTFEFCEFRNTFFCDYIPGDWSLAAIAFQNGILAVRNCLFENNYVALGTGNLSMDLPIYNCRFLSYNDTYPAPFGFATAITIGATSPSDTGDNYLLTIAKCYFTGNPFFVYNFEYTDALFLNNVLYDFGAIWDFGARAEKSEILRPTNSNVSSYGNISINGVQGWRCYSSTTADTVYARRNKLIKPINSNPHNRHLMLLFNGFGTNYVSDNYLLGCVQVKTTMSNATTSYIYNNIIENNHGNSVLVFENSNSEFQGGQVRFFNNLVRYIGDSNSRVIFSRYSSPFIYNNDFLNFSTLQGSNGGCDEIFTNNIIECTQWSSGGASQDHHPLLINNCLSMPLIDPWNLFDGGGNIVADPIFADSLNGDYSLSANSPCIDSGAYRPDLPDFDIRYHKRIVPGATGGPMTIDIGAYEYNSFYIGGINGYVYDSVSGLPVDCVKLEIIGKLPEFSDNFGFFQYPSGAGTYSVKASRWDYQDLIIPNVQVAQGEDIMLNIPLVRTNVANDDNIQSSEPIDFGLSNYPNPFNPTTNIVFITPSYGNLKLSVFNIKGQRVNMLYDGLVSKGHHSIVWHGLDDRGTAVSSGIYYVRVEMNGMSQTHKMILIK
jgi:hypothetical protein